MIKDIIIITLIVLVVIFLFFVAALGVRYLSQTIEMRTWGEFKYKVCVDGNWYATNEYKIDEKDCINFTDNYDQKWTWCEKYSVGEYYLHQNKPSWRTAYFGF